MNIFYDLHIHSCLSPCGDAEMTPYNLVHMAQLLGLSCIALTDHNSSLNCPAALEVGKSIGLTVLPGMELCTAEEVHLVCLFAQLDAAMAFSDYVQSSSIPIPNRPDIFGEQLVMDTQDGILAVHEPLLTMASGVSIGKAPALVAAHGGFCFPAHIDRSSYSVVSNLGGIDADMGFTVVEFADMRKVQSFCARFPDLQGMRLLENSDAHRLEDMREAHHCLHVRENTAQAVLDALRSPAKKNF